MIATVARKHKVLRVFICTSIKALSGLALDVMAWNPEQFVTA